MKLASLKHGRDGRLHIVNRDLSQACPADDIAPTLQAALDDWAALQPRLQKRYNALQSGTVESIAFDPAACDAPLPRCYHWADGSAYVTHV